MQKGIEPVWIRKKLYCGSFWRWIYPEIVENFRITFSTVTRKTGRHLPLQSLQSCQRQRSCSDTWEDGISYIGSPFLFRWSHWSFILLEPSNQNRKFRQNFGLEYSVRQAALRRFRLRPHVAPLPHRSSLTLLGQCELASLWTEGRTARFLCKKGTRCSRRSGGRGMYQKFGLPFG